jgi:phosphatidate cytidylyltransferase
MSRGPRRRRRQRSDVAARVLAAIPAIAFAIFIVAQGGLVFALGLIALGILAQTELYTMMARVRPANLAGFLALAGLILAAQYGGKSQILLVLVLSVPLTFFLALLRPQRENVSWAMAVTIFGIVWIGLALAHAVLVRNLDHGGGLVLDILIGTFIGDTCAYFGGRAWGRRPLAPQISPNKTLEGLVTGIVGGTLAFWLFAVAYQHEWFKGPDALLIGLCVALAGPVGDLFESLLKRDLEVKDTGRFFGAHGGVLDRLDAVLFTAVAGYYVSVAVLGG